MKRKQQIKGQPKSFVSPKNTIMVKTIPLFFSTHTDEEEDNDNDSLVNTGESVYTQISKEIFLNQTKGDGPVRVYDQLTNDVKIK